MRLARRRALGLLASGALAACAAPPPAPTSTPTPPEPSPTPLPPPPPTPTLLSIPTAPAPTAAPLPTVPGAPTATPAPAPAGRVVLAMSQPPDTLVPRLGATLARVEVDAALFTPFVAYDDRGEMVPLMAERVPSLDNGDARIVGEGDARHLEVAFRIRRGFRWHDGRPVTSRDARFWWQTLMSPKFAADDRAIESKIADVAVVDDQTFVVRYQPVQVGRLYPLAAGVLPEHVLGGVPPEQIAAHDFARRPIGSGPYRLKEWSGDQLTLEAVPDFPLGSARIQTLVFRIIREPDAQIAALKSGEADALLQVGIDVDRAPELDALAAAGTHRVHCGPSTGWEHADFNLENEHLRDARVRRAIAHAISREQIVERVLYGKTRVSRSFVQPGLPAWAWDESCVVDYPYDPARAKQLLAEAGYQSGPDGILGRSGRRLQLKLVTPEEPLRKSAAQLMQAQLRQVGIALDLEFWYGRTLFEEKGPLRTRSFDLAMYTWRGPPDPDRIDYVGSRGSANYPGYKSARADELAARGAAEVDPSKAKPVYCDLQKLWTDELPALPLYQRPVVAVSGVRLRGFRPTPTPTPETWNVHEWTLA